jgi:hypothetical protein
MEECTVRIDFNQALQHSKGSCDKSEWCICLISRGESTSEVANITKTHHFATD